MGLCLLLIAIIPGCVFLNGYKTACPQCKLWWSRNLFDKRLIDEKVVTEKRAVTRTDRHNNKHGEPCGTIERDNTEYVEVVYETYRNYYACKHCANW